MTIARTTVILLVLAPLAAQPLDSLIVKYYATGLTPGMILDRPVPREKVRAEAHFKAYYSPQGRLVSVDYIPGKKRRRVNRPGSDRSQMEFFAGWNPWRSELVEPLAAPATQGRTHYGAVLGRDDKIRRIHYFDRRQKERWIYHFRWNRQRTRAVYDIEFKRAASLLQLDKFLFSEQLCQVYAGWKARFRLRKDGRPREVVVADDLGQTMYFYRLGYAVDGAERIITSTWLRADTTVLGRHELLFKPGSTLPDRIKYFAANNRLKEIVEYEWRAEAGEVLITVREGDERLVSRRVLTLERL